MTRNATLLPPKIVCNIAISEGIIPENAKNACKILNINHNTEPFPDILLQHTQEVIVIDYYLSLFLNF